jgi:hypothetical protein
MQEQLKMEAKRSSFFGLVENLSSCAIITTSFWLHKKKQPSLQETQFCKSSFAHSELDLVSILGMRVLLVSRMSDPFRFAHVHMCPDCASKYRTQ